MGILLVIISNLFQGFIGRGDQAGGWYGNIKIFNLDDNVGTGRFVPSYNVDITLVPWVETDESSVMTKKYNL